MRWRPIQSRAKPGGGGWGKLSVYSAMCGVKSMRSTAGMSFICSVPGHADGGMRGEVMVDGAAASGDPQPTPSADGSLSAVCATNAFGMGIDRPDVVNVVHVDIPGSLEAYYQEIGRAGRDGEPAEAWLYWAAEDFARARRRIETEVEPARRQGERERLNALAGLVESAGCRRAILLRHFGEDPPEQCDNCDNCLNPPESIDATTTRASTVTRSMPTSDTRTYASITIPLSSTRSRTSIRLVPPGALSTAIACLLHL